MPITVSGTSITFNDATVQTTAGQPGTVTSVATGNGLSGGTITTSGTLTIACPSFNSVGSYCFAFINIGAASQTVTSGTNYSAGNNNLQIVSVCFQQSCGGFSQAVSNNLSGTWKWMAAGRTPTGDSQYGVACRVS